MNSKRSIYIWEIFILIYLLFSLYIIISPFKYYNYFNYLEALIWFILFIIILITNGFPKDNGFYKILGIKNAIIYCILYIIIVFVLGLFTGFSYSIYSHTITGLFNNIFPVLIMVTTRELIRYIILKKSYKNYKSIIFITCIFILYDLIFSLSLYNFNNSKEIFLFICLEFFSIVARNSLFTYISYNISVVPTLILSSVLEIIWYISPIIPSLGDYITSVLGIILPYYLYIKYKKMIEYNSKTDINKHHNFGIKIPIMLFIIVIFLLIAGIGKYKMIAIGSDSMNPIYYRGDAVIYEKVKSTNISKDDILVFKSDNMIITHRVVDIIKKGNEIYFRTKGDNNKEFDSTLVSSNDVYGKVLYIVKYIGYPTVLLQEYFKE